MNDHIRRVTCSKRILIKRGEFFRSTKTSAFCEIVNIWDINCPRNMARNKIDGFFFTTVPVSLAYIYYQKIRIVCGSLYVVNINRWEFPPVCWIRWRTRRFLMIRN